MKTPQIFVEKSTKNTAFTKFDSSLAILVGSVFATCMFAPPIYAGPSDMVGQTEAKEISRHFTLSDAAITAEKSQNLDADLLAPTPDYVPAAVTSTWKTATSGQWNVDSNWTNTPAQGGFPNDGNEGVATYDAVINASGFAYTVTLAQTETVEHLTLNSTAATLAITGGTFTAHTGIDLTTGSLLLSGGTISNSTINAASGTLNFSGSSNLLTGVAVTGDLNLTGSSAGVKIAGGTTFTTAHLANYQTAIGFAPGQTLSGTISLEGSGTGYRYIEMNGTAGTFTVGSTGVISTSTSFLGSGAIGSSSFYGGAMTLVNQGLISSQAGGETITLQPTNLSNSGTLQAQNGGILTITPTNNWTNTGTIGVDAGTVNLGGTFDATGGIGTFSNLDSGVVNITGTLLNTGKTLTLNSATGNFTLAGGTISGGTLAFANGKTLLFSGYSGNTISGVTINGDMTLNGTSAGVQIVGGTTFATAHLANSYTELAFAPGQTLTGTVSMEGSTTGPRYVSMNNTTGNFTVGSTGVIKTGTDLGGSGYVGNSGYGYSGTMTLINKGLISSEAGGQTLTINPTNLSNGTTGTMEAINSAVLTITPTNSWTNTGAINVDAGTVNLGGTFDITGGLGTFSNLDGGIVNITGTLLNTGSTLTLNSATGNFTLAGGAISGGTLAFANGKTLLFSGYSGNLLTGVTVNGDLTFGGGSAGVQIAGGTTFATAHLASNNAELAFAPGQTLTGTVSMEGSPTGSRYVGMNGTNGNFTVGSAGVIRTNTDLGGSGYVGSGGAAYGYYGSMYLINQGLISSQAGGESLTINPTSLSNRATGTLQAQNGGILTISPTNNWTNTGTISSNASTVNLGGTLDATGGIGSISATNGGVINVTGTLLNTGSTLTLNSTTGSLTLNGGTISGGTLSLANGQSLLFTGYSGNVLSAVTVNGDLTLSNAYSGAQITGGTTFATAHLANNSTELAFAPGQTMSGTVLFEGNATGSRYVGMNGTNGAFTVGSAGVIRTNTGFLGSGNVGNSNYAYGGNMLLTNQGLISSQTYGETLYINPTSLTNTGTLEATNGGILNIAPTNSWKNGGTINVNGGTINISGTFDTTTGLGTLTNTNSGIVNITGTLLNTGNTLALNATTGPLTIYGGTVSGGTISTSGGQSLLFNGTGNTLVGVTINGDITASASSSGTQIVNSTFTTAHLVGNSSGIGFAPGQTLNTTILFEGTSTGTRYVDLNGSNGTFTVGSTGVIRTNTGFLGSANIGSGYFYGGSMSLTNQGLISSQISGKTIYIGASSFSNAGTLEAINGGTLTVGNPYTQTAGTTRIGANSSLSGGAIMLNGGKLEGAGTVSSAVTSSATISPGISGAGALTLTGGLTLTGMSALQIEVGGTSSGNQYDVLNESGSVLVLNGTLSLSLINGYLPTGTSTFTVLNSNQTLTGAFANVANGGRLTTTDGLSSFQVNYGTGSAFAADDVVLSNFVTSVPEPKEAMLLAGAGLTVIGILEMLGLRRRKQN